MTYDQFDDLTLRVAVGAATADEERSFLEALQAEPSKRRQVHEFRADVVGLLAAAPLIHNQNGADQLPEYRRAELRTVVSQTYKVRRTALAPRKRGWAGLFARVAFGGAVAGMAALVGLIALVQYMIAPASNPAPDVVFKSANGRADVIVAYVRDANAAEAMPPSVEQFVKDDQVEVWRFYKREDLESRLRHGMNVATAVPIIVINEANGTVTLCECKRPAISTTLSATRPQAKVEVLKSREWPESPAKRSQVLRELVDDVLE